MISPSLIAHHAGIRWAYGIVILFTYFKIIKLRKKYEGKAADCSGDCEQINDSFTSHAKRILIEKFTNSLNPAGSTLY